MVEAASAATVTGFSWTTRGSSVKGFAGLGGADSRDTTTASGFEGPVFSSDGAGPLFSRSLGNVLAPLISWTPRSGLNRLLPHSPQYLKVPGFSCPQLQQNIQATLKRFAAVRTDAGQEHPELLTGLIQN